MTVFSSDSGSSDYCASSVTRHQPAMVRLQNIATRKPVDYKSEEAKSAVSRAQDSSAWLLQLAVQEWCNQQLLHISAAVCAPAIILNIQMQQ
jgi:hypothetical protein